MFFIFNFAALDDFITWRRYLILSMHVCMFDILGNLHFTNVAQEDGSKMYSCFASLEFIGFYSKGPATELTVFGL